MNRLQFQKIARVRIREARALLQDRMFDGAYYLAGYSVECGLKACIAKMVRRHEFPDKDLVKNLPGYSRRPTSTSGIGSISGEIRSLPPTGRSPKIGERIAATPSGSPTGPESLWKRSSCHLMECSNGSSGTGELPDR
jgi:hypothetical protein